MQVKEQEVETMSLFVQNGDKFTKCFRPPEVQPLPLPWPYSADDKLVMFFFSRKQDKTFHANVFFFPLKTG